MLFYHISAHKATVFRLCFEKNGFFARFFAMILRRERADQMRNARFVYFQNIETHRKFPARFHEKIPRDTHIFLLFRAHDRLRGAPEFVGKAGLDLAEYDRVSVQRDDVRLSVRRPVIFSENFIAEVFEKFYSPLFPCPSQNFFVNVLR